jgi:hypothetical protein
LRVLNQAFDHPSQLEEHAGTPLAGGIMQHGYQCGMIWGAVLAAGAEAYRRFGDGPQAQAMAILTARKLVESFRALTTHIDCLDITDIDKSSSTWRMIAYFLLKGGTIRCFRMAAKYAPIAYTDINAALSDTPVEPPSPPVSCTSLLAQKTGLSGRHTVMTSGLAGGIGLCGGACGALGAALWLRSLKNLQQGASKTSFDDPEGSATIDRFLACTGHKFECAKIVGRRFEDIDDHAGYVHDGGCAGIIDALAAS